MRIAAVAALGFAVSACGGGAGSASAVASAAESSTAGDTAANQGSAPVQDTTPSDGSTGQSTSGGTSTDTSSGTPSGTQAGAGGSRSGSNSPPTASAGSVTINWSPPTENTDGSALTNLAGFKIHYGTSPGKYTETITVSNPGLVRYVIDNLTPGTYYFAVTAYSSAGTESPLSPEVSTKMN